MQTEKREEEGEIQPCTDESLWFAGFYEQLQYCKTLHGAVNVLFDCVYGEITIRIQEPMVGHRHGGSRDVGEWMFVVGRVSPLCIGNTTLFNEYNKRTCGVGKFGGNGAK